MSDIDLTRRQLLIGAALLGTVGFSELYTPRRSALRLDDTSFDAMFPARVAKWQYLTASGVILPPQDQLSRTLYEQLLTRVYSTGDTPPVMLVLAYSSTQEGRLQVHRPEVCYPAAGFRIASNEERPPRVHRVLDEGGARPADPLARPAHRNGKSQSAGLYSGRHARTGFAGIGRSRHGVGQSGRFHQCAGRLGCTPGAEIVDRVALAPLHAWRAHGHSFRK
jgi:hypothetical protein